MSPTLVRQIWSALTTVSPHQIRPLDDATLLQCLVVQVQQNLYLDRQQEDDLTAYIHDRLPLIRDMCDS
jgi:hypothetical protein